MSTVNERSTFNNQWMDYASVGGAFGLQHYKGPHDRSAQLQKNYFDSLSVV